MKLPELLIPAGGREQLDAALLYGADAVYLSGSELSLRAKCDAFTLEELEVAVKDAHAKDVRVYYCINAMPYNKYLPELEKMLEYLPNVGVDGLIIADPGVLWLAKKICPQMEVHLSTQAHSVNSAAVHFWQEQGVSRINLARELGKEDMSTLIREFPEMEFEVFVHGAMCLALSGHCLMSAWINKRPANLGQCTQPCRFDYRATKLTNSKSCDNNCFDVTLSDTSFSDIKLSVEETLRRGDDCWDIEQGDDFSAIFAPSDLCLVRYMDDLIKMCPASLKLEGRTKSASYVAQVTDVYRTAIDFYGQRNGLTPKFDFSCRENTLTPDSFMYELYNTGSRPLRPLSTGFFFPDRIEEKVPDDYAVRPVVALLGNEVKKGTWEVKIRSTWKSEKDASILLQGMRRPLLKSGRYSFTNHQGVLASTLHPGMHGLLHFDDEISDLQKGLYIRA